MLDPASGSSSRPQISEPSAGTIEGQSSGGGSDFFTALGTVQSSRKEKEAVAAQVVKEEPRFHRRELNTKLIESEIGSEVTPAPNRTFFFSFFFSSAHGAFGRWLTITMCFF